ncbi:hypothetical protein RUM44_009923 [Polyplax serrata]|uniref:Queuine tRNA-ribosyltransferase accessory subunit 2 n=1 Tax=Polyplax serrata TaxID=468196 RepID=A0ABR1AU40_POLSC
MVSKQSMALHIPVSHLINIQERIKSSNSNIAKFIGMNEYLTYCSFVDSGEKRDQSCHEKDRISLWTRFGRKTFTAEEYMRFIEDLKPDLFLVLADGDTNSQCSKKRNIKSFNNTVKFFEKCTEYFEKSSTLKECQMFAAVEGGYDIKLREECSELIGKSPILGVVLDGFHDNSERTMDITFKDIKPVLEASLRHIPSDKIRIIHGCWNPSVILDLVAYGIDLFDSSYPYVITEQGSALIFPNDEISVQKHISEEMENTGEKLKKPQINVVHPPETDENNCPKRMKLSNESRYFMSLRNPSFVVDFSPILRNCTCYTCKHHTKAYIHHLLNVKEMLAHTLLMIHNLHHYLQFLGAIRKSLSSGTFEKLKNDFQYWAELMSNEAEK